MAALTERYGQTVTVYDKNGEATGQGKAFFQPVTEQERQVTAGALGIRRTDRFLCLTPAGLCPGAPGDGGWLECGGERYEVIAVHAVRLGEEQTHWWAVLEPGNEVET